MPLRHPAVICQQALLPCRPPSGKAKHKAPPPGGKGRCRTEPIGCCVCPVCRVTALTLQLQPVLESPVESGGNSGGRVLGGSDPKQRIEADPGFLCN